MPPDTKSPLRTLGDFAVLPAEVRRMIWQFLLLTDHCKVSREPDGDDANIDAFSERLILAHKYALNFYDEGFGGDFLEPQGDCYDHAFQLHPSILRASRTIYAEAKQVLYGDNFFIRTKMHLYAGHEPFQLAQMLILRSAMHYILPTSKSALACRDHFLDLELWHSTFTTKGMARVVLMVPASELHHLILRMNWLLAHWVIGNSGEKAFFSQEYGMSLKINPQRANYDATSYQRVLKPFHDMCGEMQIEVSDGQQKGEACWAKYVSTTVPSLPPMAAALLQTQRYLDEASCPARQVHSPMIVRDLCHEIRGVLQVDRGWPMPHKPLAWAIPIIFQARCIAASCEIRIWSRCGYFDDPEEELEDVIEDYLSSELDNLSQLVMEPRWTARNGNKPDWEPTQEDEIAVWSLYLMLHHYRRDIGAACDTALSITRMPGATDEHFRYALYLQQRFLEIEGRKYLAPMKTEHTDEGSSVSDDD